MDKKIILHYLLMLTPILLLGQWNQLGNPIEGSNAGDDFGYSTSINAAGDVMIAGSFSNSANGYFAGHAKVYDWDGTAWVQRGTDIEGAQDDWSGFRVSIDSVGNTVAIASIYGNNSNQLSSGFVRVYDWDGNSWVQRGADLEGRGHPVILEAYGRGLSLNAGGNIIAIGGPRYVGDSLVAGYVEMFEWNGNEWIQLGDFIEGDATNDDFGFNISINAAGNIVAIGAKASIGFGDKPEGYVKVYQWDGTNWNQLGSTLVGELPGDEFGRGIALNGQGNILAVGASGYDVVSSNLDCTAYVYEWDGTDWIQRGTTLVGEETINGFGESVSLNYKGDILAVGAPAFSTKGDVQIFEWSNDSWNQLGENLTGEAPNDIFGSFLKLNASGNTIAVGAWGNGDNGHVRVFKNESIVSVQPAILKFSSIQFFPNPTVDILNVSNVKELVEVNLLDVNGRTLFTKDIQGDSTFDMSDFPKGVYFLKIQSIQGIQTHMITKQ